MLEAVAVQQAPVLAAQEEQVEEAQVAAHHQHLEQMEQPIRAAEEEGRMTMAPLALAVQE